MARGSGSTNPTLLYKERLDPELFLSFLASLGVHLLVIVLIMGWSYTATWRVDRTEAYTVGLVSLEPGSPALGVGPLASGGARAGERKHAQSVSKPELAVAPVPAKPAPKPSPAIHAKAVEVKPAPAAGSQEGR